MAAAEYSIYLQALSPSDGGGFVATVNELPGCMSDGATRAEAMVNVHAAIGEWIDRAEALGRHIPQPECHRQYA